jgi:alcohol dehydrogenase class IV
VIVLPMSGVIRSRDALGLLPDVLGPSVRRILLVASTGTVRRVDPVGRVRAEVAVFSAFTANPTVGQAMAAAWFREACGGIDAVVGIGGASALDVAKAARVLPRGTARAAEVLRGEVPPPTGPPLVLVPTTAGPGSEVTRFATFYDGLRKLSLDGATVTADTAIIDPTLARTCSPHQTWVCAFDAFAHALESLWSTRSTAASRANSGAALALLVPVLRDAGAVPTAYERNRLAEAALLAGRAIDVTRTTAAHAFAYPLTARHGVEHGLACALNLSWLLTLAEAAGGPEVRDPRGYTFFAVVLRELRELLDARRRSLAGTVRDLLRARGLPTSLAELVPRARLGPVVEDGFESSRMDGMPLVLTRDQVNAAISAQPT